MTAWRRPRLTPSSKRGVSALEFALVLPILVTMFMGMFELASYIRANLKVTNATQLMADLVAQQTQMTFALTADFCDGAKIALAPLPTATLNASIASVTNYQAGGPTVDWSDNTCDGGPGIPNALPLAAPMIPNIGDSVIIVVSNYTYNSPLSLILLPQYFLSQTAYDRPRNVNTIPHS